MSAPNFICVLGNDVIGHLVPSLDHIDLVSVGNEVRIGSVNITIRRNIDQRSVSKLSGIFFDLCIKGITVSMDNFEARLETEWKMEVLRGSFVEGNVFLQIGGLKVVVRIC